MSFGLKTKHSLSNKFAIQEWHPLDANEVIAFRLHDGNEIYFIASELQKKFALNQKVSDVRKEIKDIIIHNLNKELNFNELKIEKYISTKRHLLGGYLITHYSGNAYIKNINEQTGEFFFDRIDENLTEKNNLSYISCEIDLIVGNIQTNISMLKVGDVHRLTPRFKAYINNGNGIFDFTLGLNEIMVIKEEHKMSIEDEIGEQVISYENIKLDVNISLGKLELSVTEMQDLLIGDFIDINHLSFPKVELLYKNKKIATAELVYNELKELSIEIQEVLIK